MKKSFLFIVPVFLISCENELSEVNIIASKEIALPVETSRNVELLYSDSAIVKAKLTAPILKYYKINSSYYEMPNGVHVDFFNQYLRRESTLKARYGIRYQNQGLVEVRDKVEVTNARQEKLETERLIWNERTGKIYTDKFVKISTADEVIYGEGLESNQNFSHYKIMKIRGIINVKEQAVE